MATTLMDIALEVGLSHVTVSKVLRGTGRIPEETRQRVLKVAERLRYRPHGMAKLMREGRTGVIGLIYSVEGTSSALSQPQLIGIQSALSLKSYELMLGLLPKSHLVEPGQTSALLRQWMADGLLINHQIGLPARIAELVEGDHVPAVWMNSKQPQNCVYFDELQGAQAAVDHLVGLGHRHIAYADVSHPASWVDGNEHYSITDRHNGYVQAMCRHGLSPSVWMPDHMLTKTERVRFIRERYVASSPRPTAIVTYAHHTEILFMAAHERLTVPDDLSVISFSGERFSVDDLLPTLLHQPYKMLGETAVQRLLDRVTPVPHADPDQLTAPVSLHLELVMGRTTSAPGQGSVERST